MSSEYFGKLLTIEIEKLSAADNEFWQNHRLGNRRESAGFTLEEREWIDSIVKMAAERNRE